VSRYNLHIALKIPGGQRTLTVCLKNALPTRIRCIKQVFLRVSRIVGRRNAV
jgi:hypothetical protein